MSYGYVGAPALFNGTLPNGGDSSTLTMIVFHLFMMLTAPRNNQPQSMVPIWRSGIHHRGLLYGPGNDTWHRLSIFWSRTKEISTVDDMGLHGIILYHDLSMVLLGILSCIFINRHIGIYWESGTLRAYERAWRTVSWKSAHTRAVVFILSGQWGRRAGHLKLTKDIDDVCCYHRSHRDRRHR